MKTLLSFFAGKFTSAVIKEFGLGSGSTWPGHIALQVNPTFIQDFLSSKNLSIILVAGTNGKTTTAKILRHILEKNGLRVFQNEEGANLVNGLATSLIRYASVTGKLRYDVAIFEVDENNLPRILSQMTPRAIVLLNLFRDQLDRYGEVHTIARNWQKALKKLTTDTQLILNADDPEIRYLRKSTTSKTFYFSIPNKYFSKKETTHDTDSTHCPQCGTKLLFSKIAYSHLGKYTCPNCKFTNENIKDKIDESIPVVLAGTYNMYNLQAALKTAREAFDISYKEIGKSLASFTSAFGRQEKITYKNRDFFMILSKNPAGFNQSISVITETTIPRSDLGTSLKNSVQPQNNTKVRPCTVLLALNDRIPDGRDVSWIWDVDFEELVNVAGKIIVTGDRAYDMAVRMKYSLEKDYYNSTVTIFENPKKAINELVQATPEGDTAFILPTYSAMLELRKILTGKEIL